MTTQQTDFKSISELHNFLDEKALFSEVHIDFTDTILEFRNKVVDEEQKLLAQWELECWMFNLLGIEVLPFAIAADSDGQKYYAYPDLKKEDQGFLKYVIERAEQATSSLLKARYYHILWKGPQGVKNKRYLTQAIENYTAVLEQFMQSITITSNDQIRQDFFKHWEHLVALTNEMKEKTRQLRALTQRILFQRSILPFHQKDSVLSKMLDYPAIFKKEDFEKALSIYEEAILGTDARVDFMLAHYSLPNAVKIAAKLGIDTKRWYSEIGECFVRMAEKPMNDNPDRAWVKQQELAQAIAAFRKGKAEKRRQEVEAAYEALKPKVKLTSFQFDYPPKMIEALETWSEEIKRTTTNLLRQSPDFIYAHLGNGSYFPAPDRVKKHSDKWMEPWLEAVTLVQFDINKNIAASNANSERGKGFWMQYKFEMKHSVLPFLYYTLIRGIKSGKLTYQNFISYLVNHTWMGTTFQKTGMDGEIFSYNWISVIAPPIVEYFVQTQCALLSDAYIPSFVLCIDSLTVKMEGLLREFSSRLGVTVSTGSPKGMQEKFIPQLLQDEVIHKHFTEEDRLFFDFLFVNKQGMDLRNDVAHSFYQFNDYNFEKMHLLIAALLRIGKYKFEEVTE